MKISELGYKKAEVEKRELTIAELKLIIIEKYNAGEEIEIQLIDITSGSTVTFFNINDVLANTWAGDCKIEIINKPHSYGTQDDYKYIFVFQQCEDTDLVIK